MSRRMRRTFAWIVLFAATGSLAPAQAGDGSGLTPPVATPLGSADQPGWSTRWYGPAASRLGTATPRPGLAMTWQVLADYRLDLAFARGLRATGGLATMSRAAITGESAHLEPGAASAESDQLPYLGLGYTASWPQPGLHGLGWTVNADVGLLSLSPRSAVRLGPLISGDQSLGGVVREMRLTPLMKIGVTYGF